MSANLPRIVHVSADFPDPIQPRKTPVIRSLLELTVGEFAHRVVSLNRRTPSIADLLRDKRALSIPFEWGEAVTYRAPPLGIFHATRLRQLGRRLAVALSPSPPDLLAGHKLTIEGLVVAEAARHLQIPYVITLQGNSDGKILAARPDLRRKFAQVFHGAAMVFAFAPWTLQQVEQRLGRRTGPSTLVPCPTDLDTPLAPQLNGEGLISAFHLAHYRNKNLAGIADALCRLQMRQITPGFKLAGGANTADAARCQRLLDGIAGASLTGMLDRASLKTALHGSAGFVMPSHRESFGLVFIEALFAGVPVVYPKDRAIAGWFDNAPFAIAVDPRDSAALANAMARLIAHEAELKQALADWQQSDHARQFTRPHIAATFSSALHDALVQAVPPLPKGAR